MEWVRRDEPRELESPGDNRCSTRKVVRSQCKTEEVEPGKFVRKCERTEEILRDCIGRPVEVIQLNEEFTEEDVMNQVVNWSFSSGSSEHQPFGFPGLRSDIESIERSLFGSMKGFFDAADEMKNVFFGSFRDPPLFERESSSSPWMRRGVPTDDHESGLHSKPNEPDSGYDDISGLARDV